MKHPHRLLDAAERQGYRRAAMVDIVWRLRHHRAEEWEIRLIQEIIRTRHAYKAK